MWCFFDNRWQKELRRIQEAVSNLRRAKALYMQRHQEYERCREALRIAEQGAELGATGENKVNRAKISWISNRFLLLNKNRLRTFDQGQARGCGR